MKKRIPLLFLIISILANLFLIFFIDQQKKTEENLTSSILPTGTYQEWTSFTKEENDGTSKKDVKGEMPGNSTIYVNNEKVTFRGEDDSKKTRTVSLHFLGNGVFQLESENQFLVKEKIGNLRYVNGVKTIVYKFVDSHEVTVQSE